MGVKDFLTKVQKLSTKKRDDGRGGSKIVQNCVTSFMDDHLQKKQEIMEGRRRRKKKFAKESLFK